MLLSGQGWEPRATLPQGWLEIKIAAPGLSALTQQSGIWLVNRCLTVSELECLRSTPRDRLMANSLKCCVLYTWFYAFALVPFWICILLEPRLRGDPTVTFQPSLASGPSVHSCDNLGQHFQSPSTSHSRSISDVLESPQWIISISKCILKSH